LRALGLMRDAPGIPGVMEPSWMFQSSLSCWRTAPYFGERRVTPCRRTELPLETDQRRRV
jgi:hypothetical protein